MVSGTPKSAPKVILTTKLYFHMLNIMWQDIFFQLLGMKSYTFTSIFVVYSIVICEITVKLKKYPFSQGSIVPKIIGCYFCNHNDARNQKICSEVLFHFFKVKSIFLTSVMRTIIMNTVLKVSWYFLLHYVQDAFWFIEQAPGTAYCKKIGKRPFCIIKSTLESSDKTHHF